MAPTRSRRYWMARRQLFFVQQRIFGLVSLALLDNAVSGRLRLRAAALCGARVGRGASARGGLTVLESFRLVVGDNSYIGNNCTVDCSAPVRIGRNVEIAYGAMIVTGTHRVGAHAYRAGPTDPRPVTIGDGCWIGAGALILPGVTIGDGAIVGAGSVVTEDVAPDTVVAGNPARPVRALAPDGSP